MSKEHEIIERNMWDHYSELPNPAWYAYKNELKCEWCDNVMTEEDHNFSDVCGDCFEENEVDE